MSCLRTKKKCKYSLCNTLTRDANGYCEAHQHLYVEWKRKEYKRIDEVRKDNRSGWYDYRWQRVRKAVLSMYPICQHCNEVVATEVHHIESIASRPDLRLAYTNLMAVCYDCHKAIEREKMRQKVREIDELKYSLINKVKETE